MTRADDKQEN